MLCQTPFALCRVSSQNYKSRITAETRRAIAGLDADAFGFSRKECCGPVPAELRGSFQATDHVFLNTALPPTEWAKRTQNVPAYTELNRKLKDELPSANIAVCHTSEFPPNTVFRFCLDGARRGQSRLYTLTDPTVQELPWAVNSPPSVDCALHYFIFICSHRSRDARCGYCGPVLVDVISQEVERAVLGGKAVHVIPCSHFGGHAYAGNTLVYSRRGGVCFGCVTPSDAGTIVELVRNDDGVVPEALKDRVRGRMTAGAEDGSAPNNKLSVER